MIGYIHESRLSEFRFFSKVFPDFPHGTEAPSVQYKIYVPPKTGKKTLTRDEIWGSLPDSLHKTELNEKTSLEALNKVLPNIQKKIDETEILVWNKLETVEIMDVFFMPHGIWNNIQYKINQITPKGTRFKRGVPYFWNFLA